METPSIPDNDGEFCWELDVELEFRLEEQTVFLVLWKFQLDLDTKESLHISFTSFLSLNSPGYTL